MINNFDEILLELSYRTETGLVDLTQDSQVNILIDILKENGVENAEVFAQKARVYFSYLNEASILEKGKNPAKPIKAVGSRGGAAARPAKSAMKPATQSKAKKPQTGAASKANSLAKDAQSKGVIHLGKGYYGKSKGAPATYKKDDSGARLVKIKPGEGPQYKGSGEPTQKEPQQKQTVGGKQPAAGGKPEAPKPNIKPAEFRSDAEDRIAIQKSKELSKHDAGLSAATQFFAGKKYKNNNGDDVSFDAAINYNDPNDNAHIAAMDDFESFLNANQGEYGTLENPKQPNQTDQSADTKAPLVDKNVRSSIKEFENYLSDAQKLAIKLEEKKRIVELKKLDTLSQSFNKLPPEARNAAGELFAKGQLFEGRENSGNGKNRLGYLDIKTLDANRKYLIKAYGDGSPETIKKLVRNARRIKVSEEYVESSFNLLPPSLQSSLMGKGKVGDAGKDKHFLGYVRMDGTVTSDQSDKNIKKDRNGNPEVKRGNPGNRDRGKFVWRCILEQGGQDPYTGLPLDLSSIDLEHVRAFDNKDTGTPTAKDYLNREHDNNIVICATNVNQKKSNLSIPKFYETQVNPQVGKSKADFEKETQTFETINKVASQTEQKAGLIVKGGKLKPGYNYKNLKALFDNDDLVYNKAKDEFKKVAETNEDKKAIAGLNSEIGKATLMALGLGRGIIDKSGRRTIKLSSDNLYRGFLLSMAEQPNKQDKFKAGWEAARKVANSDKFRLKGRGQQGMIKYLIDNKFISKSVLNDPKLGKVFKNALNEVYDYQNNIYILID